MNGSDHAALKAQLDVLSKATTKIGEAVYKNAAGQQQQQPQDAQEAQPQEAETVDAEFKKN